VRLVHGPALPPPLRVQFPDGCVGELLGFNADVALYRLVTRRPS
jgi:hypothetical protein